jgi:hypothetical protein
MSVTIAAIATIATISISHTITPFPTKVTTLYEKRSSMDKAKALFLIKIGYIHNPTCFSAITMCMWSISAPDSDFSSFEMSLPQIGISSKVITPFTFYINMTQYFIRFGRTDNKIKNVRLKQLRTL